MTIYAQSRTTLETGHWEEGVSRTQKKKKPDKVLSSTARAGLQSQEQACLAFYE